MNGYDVLYHLDIRLLAFAPVAAACLIYALPYFADRHRLRSYPGPLLAKVSNLWFSMELFRSRNSFTLHKAHEKYGTFVRIAPNQVSIADPEAPQAIYGYSAGAQKGEIYEGFIVFKNSPSMFSTRLRDVHSRKRKYLSHVMSMKSIQELEPNILHHQQTLAEQWDAMCAAGTKNAAGTIGSSAWKARDGRIWFNCQPWFHYAAFDTIGDLAFGQPFGMLESGEDAAPVVVSQESAMESYYKADKAPIEYTTVPAIKTISQNGFIGSIAGSLGGMRSWTRSILSHSMFNERVKYAGLLPRMAVSAVAKRLTSGEARPDFLTKLITARDDSGHPLSEGELSAEASSFIVAGSDTVSSSLGGITWYLARNLAVQAKLRKELDLVLGLPSSDSPIATYDQLKNITYLQDVINESLRLHSTVGIGLPRVVPETGMSIAGKTFTAGTEISCPTYTIHRLKSVWGQDADEFNPERWSQGNRDKTEMMKCFIPFSIGPRACIGRHLAMVEMTVCVATIFHRYEVVLENPHQNLEYEDGFTRRAKAVHIGLKKRV